MQERPTPSAEAGTQARSARVEPDPRWIAFLHLAALSSIAVGQPLLDVLARDATFFVARRANAADLIALVLGVFVFLPLFVFAVQLALSAANRRTGEVALRVCVGGFAALIVAPALQRVLGDETSLSAWLALAAGGLAAFAYARVKPVRTFVTVLSPAPLVFAGLFLFNPAIQKVWNKVEIDPNTRRGVASKTTLVMVVLDELPLTSLMNSKLAIDARLFPNFARLAADSTWFRNATASHESTEQALPAIMTGIEPSNQELLPTTADHPDNIFTLLAGSHRMKIWETFTDVCPPELSGRTEDSASFAERTRAMALDSAVVYGHIVLPKPWREALPSITERWGGFATDNAAGDATDTTPGNATDNATATAGATANGVDRLAEKDSRARQDRAEAFQTFIDAIDDDAMPSFYFLHIMLPHGPWIYLPSGKRYDPCGTSPGYSDGRWTEDASLTALAYQRHLLQLGAVDRLLGKLLDRLHAQRVYEQALVVVLADHGVSLVPGQFGRRVFPKNAQEIARMPLFFKLPGKSDARVVDANVETIDIVPTIADVMGFEVPWRTAGRSALAENAPARATKIVHRKSGKPMTLDAALPESWPQLEEKIALFGAEPTWDRVFARGDEHGLIGRTPLGTNGDEIRIAPEFSAEFERAERYAKIDRAAPELPCFVKGLVRTRGHAALPSQVAIAVNGAVRAVTKVYEPSADQASFAALVPESAFVDGANSLTLFSVQANGELHAIAR